MKTCPFALALALALPTVALAQTTTDSLSQPGPYQVVRQDQDWYDTARQREVPVRIYAPRRPAQDTGLSPLLVFSHGLGGDRRHYVYIGEHLASYGYVVIHPTHVGSDSQVLLDGGRIALQLAAVDPRNRIDRPRDVSFVIDQVERRQGRPGLLGSVDLNRIGVAGHSFGAYTALASVGQTVGVGPTQLDLHDPRIRCAIAMSPQGPGVIGLVPESWDGIQVPVHTMTGTEDVGLGTDDVAERRVAFDSMPPGFKYHLTIANAEHSAFSDSNRPGVTRDPRHHGWILAATTAFFRAALERDLDALRWLNRRQLQRDTAGEVIQERR